MFIPKMRFFLGSLGFLLAGSLSSYAYESNQLTQKDYSVHSQKASTIPQQHNLLDSSLITANFSLPASCNLSTSAPCQKPASNTLYKPQLLSQAYKVIDELQKYQFSINGNKLFSSAELPSNKINFNQADLLATLVNTRQYYQDHTDDDPNISRPGVLGTQNVSVEDITKTLDFMIGVLREDIANNRTTRLQDPSFINSNFRVIKWSAYNPKETQRKNLRITKYAVFVHPGSRKKTAKFNVPLYSLKDTANTTDKFYTKYTKQDVLSGIYETGGKESGKVEPIVYMTREGLEEALMEGTILVDLGGGSSAYFNVDRSNEIPYVRGLNPRSQKRYWYFREVKDIKGYGYKIDQKISIKPGVTFAGDVLNIGLGRMIVMEYMQNGRKQLRMGVIADTGGAFLPNFHQLDFLAGIFPNKNSFNQYINQLPTYATAYVLIKK